MSKRRHSLLDASTRLEQSEANLTAYTLIILIAIFLGLSLLWAQLTEVDEIARTKGEVVMFDKTLQVRHSQGGVVEEIFVKNGDIVKKGQRILSIDKTATRLEIEKLIIQIAALTANKIRYRSLLTGKSISFENLLKLTKQQIDLPKEHAKAITEMIKDLSILSKMQSLTDLSEVAVLYEQQAQADIELQSLQEQRKMLDLLLSVMDEEKKIYTELNKKSLASKKELLSATRQHIKIKQEHLEAIRKTDKQKKLLLELKGKLVQKQNDNNLVLSEKLNETHSELLKARRQLEKLLDLSKKLSIRSAVDGVVKGLDISIGSTIGPNQTILDIVPVNSPMMVETKIEARDIGHIKVGAEVKVKVATFEYIRFGMLHGKLTHISASTFLDTQTNTPYYKGTISLKKDYLGKTRNEQKLMPGMQVEADIYTGKKSVLAYLLKPIYLSVNRAFSER